MSRARVLVADDKEAYVALFRRLLPADVEVLGVARGDEALSLLRRGGFDVVVSDVRMPGLDGLALVERIREEALDVDVVLMTAYGTIPDAVRAMQLGAFDYLTKPFEPDDAVAVVERALARRAARRGAATGDDAAARPLVEMSYREVLAAGRDKTTREYLVALLREVQGNVTQAAERAGIERESFHRLMKRYGVKSEEYRGR